VTGGNMVFEKIRKADREEYLAMEHDFYHSPAVLHPIPDENHKLTFDVLMEGSPYTVCFMFRSDDKKEVYGFALLALTYSNEAGGIVVWLEEIYVKPEHRCKGITGEFFKFIEKEYADAARIRLETEPDNERAVRLYERNGFAKLGYSQMYKDN
jgi:hypothetical protein